MIANNGSSANSITVLSGALPEMQIFLAAESRSAKAMSTLPKLSMEQKVIMSICRWQQKLCKMKLSDPTGEGTAHQKKSLPRMLLDIPLSSHGAPVE